MTLGFVCEAVPAARCGREDDVTNADLFPSADSGYYS